MRRLGLVIVSLLIVGRDLGASPAAPTEIVLIDKDCKALFGSKVPAIADVRAETVILSGGDMPFRCIRKHDDVLNCLSSRSKRSMELRLATVTDNVLVIESIGGGNASVRIVVYLQDKTFQVASWHGTPADGLAVELCSGTAAVK